MNVEVRKVTETLKKEKEAVDPSFTFPVIGIGASAGGLDPFSHIVADLLPDLGAAYVLVQHLSPDKNSQLSDILSRRTMMPLNDIKENELVEPNHIYISPPGSIITINKGAFKLTPFNEKIHPKTIDALFTSLAEERGRNAVGIILSGTGSDGVNGLRAIKENGGITLAQTPDSSQFPDMPINAISAGVIDHTYSLMELSKELSLIILKLKSTKNIDNIELDNHYLDEIFNLLRSRFGVDFTQYHLSTINRRLQKRMGLIRVETLENYVSLLKNDAAEVEALYNDILINVTSFFRDPQSFKALLEKAFPKIFEGRTSNDALRIWVPGCSTGQEVYSLAILIIEYISKEKIDINIQIFSTDIDEDALKIARTGFYSNEDVKPVSPERLDRFFDKQTNGYKISKKVRDLCVFARHDVTSDPPFARLTLISCRNLMIYLEKQSQSRIFQGFHYALAPKGVLFLGATETVHGTHNLFSVLDKKYNIYLKKIGVSHLDNNFLTITSPIRFGTSVKKKPMNIDPINSVHERADEIVLDEYAPAGVVVNEDFEIIQFRGKTGRFLEPRPGAPSLNILNMVKEPLLMRLRITLEKAKKENKAIVERGVTIEVNGSLRNISLDVKPFKIQQSTERFYLILFKDSDDQKDALKEAETTTIDDQLSSIDNVETTKRELAETREYLRVYIEEQESTTEELKSTNEELQANYEELISTTEELETTKEELQVSSEETTTLNEELQNRNLELIQLNDDMTNLISSIQIPLLIVGGNMHIRMVTSYAEKMLGVLPGDVGRRIGDLNLHIVTPDLEQVVSNAIKELRASAIELKDRDGHWFSLRLNLYRTADNRIDGCVISFIDINDVKQNQLMALDAKNYAENVVETIRDPLIVLDSDLRIISTNRAFHQTFKLQSRDVIGKYLYEIEFRQWGIPDLKMLLEKILPNNSSFQDFEIQHESPSIGKRVMLLSGRQIMQETVGRKLILLTFEDITERRKLEEETQNYSKNLESLLEQKTSEVIEAERLSAAGKVAAMIGHDLRGPLQAVKNNLYLLRKSPKEAEKKLEAIDEAVTRMDAMVEELRSKIRDTPLAPQAVDLADLIGLCLKETPVPPGVKTQLVVGVGLDSVTLDPLKMRRVLDNLVMNALDAMPEGGNLTVSAEVVGSEAFIKVSDTGVGIPETELPKLFKAFYTTKPKGLGLGLAFCRRAVEAHGGTIMVESKVGEGATFTVTLPLHPRARPENPARATPLGTEAFARA